MSTPTPPTAKVAEVLRAKAAAGPDAYLWLHSSGDCLLWPDEAASEDDDGQAAIARWQLADDEAAALLATGQVDETA